MRPSPRRARERGNSLCACGLGLLSLLVTACYDHRVTQALMERKQRAREAEGTRIRASGPAPAGAANLVGHLRFYVADDYRKQHTEWRAPLIEIVRAANPVIGPSFGTRLDVASIEAWSPTCDPAQLGACLEELARLDPGEDGIWIIGVLGALPRFTESFDELGMAHVPGRHMIVRDVPDLAERDAIDRAFATFTQSRREEIYKRRKAHKRLAVFLHEWGHTLGALHSSEADSLLHPRYDDRMEAYDGANQGLMSAALDDRFSGRGDHAGLIAYLERARDGSWPEGEQPELLARLRAKSTAQPAARESQQAAPQADPPSHMYVVNGSEEALLSGVGADERTAYRDAVRSTVAGSYDLAWQALAPLVPRFADCYAIQHLACGLAMQLGRQGEMQSSCSRAQKLASSATATGTTPAQSAP